MILAMRKRIKDYLVFTSGMYRGIVFLVMPLLLILVDIVLFAGLQYRCLIGQMIMAYVIIQIESVLDYWAFGAIAIKGGKQLEYFKVSVRGKRIVQNALCFDLLRILVESGLCYFVGIAIYIFTTGNTLTEQEIWISLNIFMLQYIACTLVLTFVRFFDSILINISIAEAGVILFAFGAMLGTNKPGFMLAIEIIIAAISSIINIITVMRRMEVSYCDRED